MIWDGLQRRKFERGNIPFKLFLYTADGHILCAYTEDLGRGGARVIIDQRLEVNSKIALEIYLEEDSTMCEGRIVWVQEKENPSDKENPLFETGIEFVRLLSDNFTKEQK